ncbi:MAG TPA: DMT family transporter [Gemmatimonadales bacterium]|nr:DMT family transporter [Gemmatimonadales bacterium]
MGYLYILAAALLWATIGPAARFALRAGIDPLEISFWRAAIAGGLFAVHAAARGRLRVAPRDLPAVLAFAVFGVTVFYWSYFRAVDQGGAALAAILLYTAPAWVALAATLWLGERLTRRKALAVALTLAGIVLVALGSGTGMSGGSGGRTMALAWGLLAGLAYAVYYLFGKRYFTRYDASTLFAYALPVGALLLLPAVPFAPKAAADWLVLVFVAVVPTYAAYLLYGLGLTRVEATRAATVATLEPVAAAALAFLIWGEALRGAGYAGAACVLAGVLLVATEPEPLEPPHEGPAAVH